MQSLAQWTTRLRSRPVIQQLQLPLEISVHSSRCFSFRHSLLEMLDPKLEAKRQYEKVYKQKRRREDKAFRDAERALVYKHRQTRISADPAWAEAKRKYVREHSQRSYRENPQVRGRTRFYDWVTCRRSKIREGLVWKTHIPILYDQKVKHICVDCGYTPRGGLKLWQQISDPSLYKCFKCYCAPEVSKAMPIGWEHIVSGRKKKTIPAHPGAETASSSSSIESESDTRKAEESTEDEKKSG